MECTLYELLVLSQTVVRIHCCLSCSINLDIRRGRLVGVVGHVGAGKSSLIQALLGEMEKISGSVSLKVTLNFVITLFVYSMYIPKVLECAYVRICTYVYMSM